MDKMLKNGKKIRMAHPKRKTNPFRRDGQLKVMKYQQLRIWFAHLIEKLTEHLKRVTEKLKVRVGRWFSYIKRKYPEVIKIKRATLISLIVFAILLSSFFSIMLVSCIYDGNQPIETTVPPIQSNTTTPTVTLTPTITETPTTEPLPDHK